MPKRILETALIFVGLVAANFVISVSNSQPAAQYSNYIYLNATATQTFLNDLDRVNSWFQLATYPRIESAPLPAAPLRTLVLKSDSATIQAEIVRGTLPRNLAPTDALYFYYQLKAEQLQWISFIEIRRTNENWAQITLSCQQQTSLTDRLLHWGRIAQEITDSCLMQFEKIKQLQGVGKPQ
ncbi:MAG: hypothetical protein KDK39_06560 [Leptospiraceae bacterium]|nr:hypothetical protein [Leptospiraceae bacterium]